jgi:hypothetical protein
VENQKRWTSMVLSWPELERLRSDSSIFSHFGHSLLRNLSMASVS